MRVTLTRLKGPRPHHYDPLLCAMPWRGSTLNSTRWSRLHTRDTHAMFVQTERLRLRSRAGAGTYSTCHPLPCSLLFQLARGLQR